MKFAPVTLRSNKGGTVTGEFIVESSTAWQVAVDGKVQSYMKDEWTSIATPKSGFNIEDLLGGGFGR